LKTEADNTAAFRPGSLVRLFFVLSLLLISVPALADAATIPATPETFDLDSIDCIAADDADEEPLQATGNPARLPGGPEQGPSVSADRANLPSRSDHLFSSFILPPSSFSLTRSVGTVPAFLFPTSFSDSLREHLRERAPPSLI
jgi:hypothetical protein